MKYVYIVVVIAIAIIAALFAGQNSATSTVSFFGWSGTGPLSLIIVISIASGLSLGVLIMLPSVIGGSFRHFVTRHKLKRIEKKSGKSGGRVLANRQSDESEPLPDSAPPAFSKKKG